MQYCYYENRYQYGFSDCGYEVWDRCQSGLENTISLHNHFMSLMFERIDDLF